MKPGLARIDYLLQKLGNPEQGFPSIHIAGTNGKGSTAAILTSILTAAGKKVGLYTSPHLQSRTERVQVSGRPIGEAELTSLLTHLRELGATAPDRVGTPTEFELLTAAALACFAEKQVDIAVVEVGLGGRLDATNVLNPLISVITPVGLDHQSLLGDTLPEIAAEKAGIIKGNTPVISAPQEPEAAAVLAKVAACRQSSYYQLASTQVTVHGMDRQGVRFSFQGLTSRWKELQVALLGRHQAENAATAIAVIESLSTTYDSFADTSSFVPVGLGRVRWPGRLELIGENPPVILDGAHNPAGIRVLARALRELFPHEKFVFVLGILAGKPVEEMIRPLLDIAHGFICTAPVNPRTPPLSPRQLAEEVDRVAGAAGISSGFIEIQSAESALERARHLGIAAGVPVCLTGSLYLVGELRKEAIRNCQGRN